MLCAPVFIFTSGSSALLGRPRCGSSIWLSLLTMFNTLCRVYVNLFHEKMDKTWTYSTIFVWNKNGRLRLLGAQSINIESLFEGVMYRTIISHLSKGISFLLSISVSKQKNRLFKWIGNFPKTTTMYCQLPHVKSSDANTTEFTKTFGFLFR